MKSILLMIAWRAWTVIGTIVIMIIVVNVLNEKMVPRLDKFVDSMQVKLQEMHQREERNQLNK